MKPFLIRASPILFSPCLFFEKKGRGATEQTGWAKELLTPRSGTLLPLTPSGEREREREAVTTCHFRPENRFIRRDQTFSQVSEEVGEGGRGGVKTYTHGSVPSVDYIQYST